MAGLQTRLEERLSALLARSGTWTQRVRLAFPDGSLLLEPDDTALTVAELLEGPRWQEAEATREAQGLPDMVQTPSGATKRRSQGRSDSKGAMELEKRLGKLQEAKHLPLMQSRERKQPSSPAHSTPAADGSNATSDPGANAGRSAGAGRLASPPEPSDLAPTDGSDRVLMASSRDEDHPADNIIDGNDKTYWISTGLYPQEILLELAQPRRVSGVRLSTTNVRSVRIEGCSEPAATTFETLGSAEMDAKSKGNLQSKQLKCREQSQPIRFVKTMILSGWHDFCSVHRIVVE